MSASKLRYLAPNLATLGAMACGFLSIVAAIEHRFVDSGWLILLATFLDRADGLLARSLKATSAFGVQMDSFADFFDFGVAPAVLVFVALTSTPELPFGSGAGYALVLIAGGLWVAAATFRLARFNVLSDHGSDLDKSLFHGIPTTLAAGLLINWFLVGLKYATPHNPLGAPHAFGEPRLLGSLALGPNVWLAVPVAMLIGAALMISNVRCKKFVLFRSKLASSVMIGLSGAAFTCIFFRVLPEFTVALPSVWLGFWLVYGQIAPRYRGKPVPPLFPVGDDELS